MRIGIVGAESSHTIHIASTLNVDRAIPGCEVTHVWGETDEAAGKAAAEGRIPTIVADPCEMIGAVDGVVVDHRHGEHHLPAARPFVEAGLPVFVDKPFCTDLDAGVEFVRFARERGVPVCSYSVLPLQQSALAFARDIARLGALRSLVTAGPADIDSEYGGVFFYAIHQVELICGLVDGEPTQVSAVRRGHDGVAAVTFESGPLAVVHCLKDWWGPGFVATAYGDKGVHHAALPFDEKMYLSGIQRFCEMFRTGREPAPPHSYLRCVAVLQAMQESFDTGGARDVRPIPAL